ncbi:MAG: tetratricopeptide repeat protein [Muribaculaceae bacterium]|nr:tetratricopeptide repeat protein [Muribaculaceae bacterium]
MTENPINITEISALLKAGRVNDALNALDNASDGLRMLSPFKADLERLRQQYGYMSDFALRGLPDPGLPEAMDALKGDILSTADAMSRAVTMTDAPTLYYSMARTASAITPPSLSQLKAEYGRLAQKLSLAALAENPMEASKELTLRSEALEKEIFNSLWISYPLSSTDAETYTTLISDPSLPSHVKSLAVSALTLGLMEWYDERRMLLLMDGYCSTDAAVSVRSLCGLLMGMWQWRNRPQSRKLRLRLDSLRETPSWPSDVRMATMQFIRARDTERLTRKFNDELLPEMMKLRPEIEKLRHKPIDPDSALLEENPEWAELLDKSGLSDKLKELQEIQEDGGDVMMATFSRLKTFPFFHDPANWFMPFHTGRSELHVSGLADLIPLIDVIGNTAAFCDSDKYSVALSLTSIPSGQRDMMMQQLRMQADQLDQIRAAGMNTAKLSRESLTADYVRNLYRFYKLFRRKAEFRDPFADAMNLPALPDLREIFDDADTLRLIGEFYFRRRYFEDAFDVFSRLDLLVTPEAELYQKMGYCRQALGDISEAIRFYEQSEMLNPQSRWTRRRLASCQRAAGNYESALRYYRSLSESKPDDVKLILNTGLCLLKLRRFDEALQQLFKAEYLGADSPKALRAIAWCTLLDGDYERCRTFTSRIMDLPDHTPTDYLNAGHLELLTGSPTQAAERYADSIASRDFDNEGFRADLNRDIASVPALAALNPLTVSIIADRASIIALNKGHRI